MKGGEREREGWRGQRGMEGRETGRRQMDRSETDGQIREVFLLWYVWPTHHFELRDGPTQRPLLTVDKRICRDRDSLSITEPVVHSGTWGKPNQFHSNDMGEERTLHTHQTETLLPESHPFPPFLPFIPSPGLKVFSGVAFLRV